jgi:hypothetical protein
MSTDTFVYIRLTCGRWNAVNLTFSKLISKQNATAMLLSYCRQGIQSKLIVFCRFCSCHAKVVEHSLSVHFYLSTFAWRLCCMLANWQFRCCLDTTAASVTSSTQQATIHYFIIRLKVWRTLNCPSVQITIVSCCLVKKLPPSCAHLFNFFQLRVRSWPTSPRSLKGRSSIIEGIWSQ